MGSSQINTKLNTIYTKLFFQGYLPAQISPNEDIDSFYSSMLDLDVDRAFLQGILERLTKDECLGPIKVRAFTFFFLPNCNILSSSLFSTPLFNPISLVLGIRSTTNLPSLPMLWRRSVSLQSALLPRISVDGRSWRCSLVVQKKLMWCSWRSHSWWTRI